MRAYKICEFFIECFDIDFFVFEQVNVSGICNLQLCIKRNFSFAMKQ